MEPDILLEHVTKTFSLYGRTLDRVREWADPSGGKRHREFHALKDVCLEVPRGETLGIVGRNGSGKSTLLKIVAGIMTPTSGVRRVRGRVSALLELASGFNPDYTGVENVYLNGAILGHSRAEVDRRLDEILSFADIGVFARQPVRTYSSGMLVRLAFAVAVTVDPEILVVDEALAVGDASFQRKCYARIRRLIDDGRTVLLVSHNFAVVTQVCRRAVLLDAGEIILDGRPKVVRAFYFKLSAAAGGDPAQVRKEIAALPRGGAGADDPAPAAPSIAAGDLAEDAIASGESADGFTDDLTPPSLVQARVPGIEVSGVEIRNEAGDAVNRLTVDATYTFSFRVKFGVEATGVRFGSIVRTVAGATVSTAHAPDGSLRRVERVPAGDEMEASWRFRCRLLAGTYFADVFVQGSVDGGPPALLYRIADAAVFEVPGDPDSPYGGIVHLDQRAEVRKVDRP